MNKPRARAYLNKRGINDLKTIEKKDGSFIHLFKLMEQFLEDRQSIPCKEMEIHYSIVTKRNGLADLWMDGKKVLSNATNEDLNKFKHERL